MLVITALNIVVVIMAYLARFDKHRYLLAWAFVLLALVLGVRYGYGNDYFSYKLFFDKGHTETVDADDIEPGWRLINYIFKPFGFASMVFFLTGLEHFLLYVLIRRHVPPNYYWLAVFLYVFNPYYMLVGLSMMRQFLVQIIGLYVLEMAIQKKIVFFLMLVIVGFLIHKVALLLLIFLILPYISLPKWWAYLGVFVAIVLIVNNLMPIVEQTITLFQGTGMDYANNYLNEQVLGEEHKLGLKTIFHYVFFMIVFIRNLKYVDERQRPFAWVVILGIMILPFQTVFPMASRTSWIYTIGEILGIPLLLCKERIPILKYGLTSLFLLNMLLFEYRSFWSSEVYGAYYRNFTTLFFD